VEPDVPIGLHPSRLSGSAPPFRLRFPAAASPPRRFQRDIAVSWIDPSPLCYSVSHMKTTTVRELRNNYSQVLKWVAKGEEVDVTRRGKIVAKVVPPSSANAARVDWSQSAALTRRPWSTALTAEESAAMLADSQSR
jgi:prevent-host-death family protein